MRGRVLIVAGSDSGGGAGIQADIKTVTALNGYAATAITALTAQNTQGVFGIHEVPVDFIRQQMQLVLQDIGADCVKTGMLHRPAVIEAVCAELDAHARDVPLVVDPVMVSQSGHRLLDPAAMDVLKRDLILRATVLTPNVPEAELLTGMTIRDTDDMHHAGQMLLTLGPQAVLVKGGHIQGETVTDLLVTQTGTHVLSASRIDTNSNHGTGCTLASALACGLAQGLDLQQAVDRARTYLREALRTAPGFGKGSGPLNHAHPCGKSGQDFTSIPN